MLNRFVTLPLAVKSAPGRGSATPAAVGHSCPACGGKALLCLGELPDSTFFGGIYHHRVFHGGQLFRCRNCALGFRHPRHCEAELYELYVTVSPTHWSVLPEQRNDFAAIRCALTAAGRSGRVLDIGCHTGGLLQLLPGYWDKFGIEPNSRAAEVAERSGVKVVGGDVGCLREYPASFDAVTAVDILEHIYQPVAFLGAIKASLRPGGILLIGTGNMDAAPWRLMGARYHYCSLAEHVTFLSPSWCRWVAQALGMRVVAATTFAHHRSAYPAQQFARDLCANLAFLAVPAAFRALARLKRVKGREYIPPAWPSARDHFLCVMEHDGSPNASQRPPSP